MCVTPRFGSLAGTGRRRQETIYTAGFAGRSLPVPVSPDRLDLEAAVLRKLGSDAGAHFAGVAGCERTAATRAAFDRCRIVRRAMHNVSV